MRGDVNKARGFDLFECGLRGVETGKNLRFRKKRLNHARFLGRATKRGKIDGETVLLPW